MSAAGDVLRSARDRIAAGQWTKGAMAGKGDDGSPTYCALGAMAAGELKHGTEGYWRARDALTNKLPAINTEGVFVNGWKLDAMDPIAAFNDHPDTTREDVVMVFDKTLAELGEL